MVNTNNEKDKEQKIRKNYIIKESTVRMVSELKLIHPDINAKASDIVEKAIRYYYEYIKKDGGNQRDEF